MPDCWILCFALATFFLLMQLRVNVFSKMLTFLVAGSLAELVFYLSMQADFSSIFLFSIIDKFPAAAFGAIAFYFRDRGHV